MCVCVCVCRKHDLTVCSFASLEQAGNEIKVHREISKIVISGPLRQAHFNSMSLFISKDHKCDHYIQESAAVIPWYERHVNYVDVLQLYSWHLKTSVST